MVIALCLRCSVNEIETFDPAGDELPLCDVCKTTPSDLRPEISQWEVDRALQRVRDVRRRYPAR